MNDAVTALSILGVGGLVGTMALGRFVGRSAVRDLQARLDSRARLSASSKGAAVRAQVRDPLLHGTLPPPVSRYFKKTFPAGTPPLSKASLHQVGRLRTDTASETWMRFEAHEEVTPLEPGFVWVAKVGRGPFHVQVVDSYLEGRGGGLVRLFSAIPLGKQEADPRLDSGALHRFLAEAPWFPQALLPAAGVEWTPIDNERALASLKAHGQTVTLEFHFNKEDDIVGVFSPGRWGNFNGEFRREPWEGHFSDHAWMSGLRIPLHGEVGWHDGTGWKPVWVGRVVDVEYRFVS